MWIMISWLVVVCHVITSTSLEIRMPGVQTDEDDAYLCYAKPLEGKVSYITGFQPLHNPDVTHHMILFGCDEPGSEEDVWDCNHGSPVCKDTEKIIFSWAMNAPPYEMPKDTSFKIGEKGYRNLVLQVHYKDSSYFKESPDRTDNSGWKLETQDEPTSYLSGVYILVDGTSELRPHSESLTSIGCTYTGDVPIHPFAFRVHAHGHGLRNRGFVEHNGKDFLIGEKSPQKPQTFYSVENKTLLVVPGDKLKADCLFNNNEDRVIRMGHTRQDEMCNFYIMYSVPLQNSRQLLDEDNQQCLSAEIQSQEQQMKEEMRNMWNELEDEFDVDFPEQEDIPSMYPEEV